MSQSRYNRKRLPKLKAEPRPPRPRRLNPQALDRLHDSEGHFSPSSAQRFREVPPGARVSIHPSGHNGRHR